MNRNPFSTKWTPDRERAWQLLRKKGRYHFIIFRGVLFWGLFTAIFMSVFQYFILPDQLQTHNIVINFILFPIAGFVWGLLTWNWTERSFIKYKKG